MVRERSRVQSSLAAPSSPSETNTYGAALDRGATVLQNFAGTNEAKTASPRTNPVQAAALCSRDVSIENENPGALAGATGADDNGLTTTTASYHSDALVAMNMERARHVAAARMFRWTLALDRSDVWVQFAQVASVRLMEIERAKAAIAFLQTLPVDLRERVLELTHWGAV